MILSILVTKEQRKSMENINTPNARAMTTRLVLPFSIESAVLSLTSEWRG